MSESKAKCPFCETNGVQYYDDKKNQCYEFSCPICGVYIITQKAMAIVNEMGDKYNLVNCVSENIKTNSRDGNTRCFWHLSNEQMKNEVDDKTIYKKVDYFLPLPIVHSDKAFDIMLHVARLLEGKDPFSEVKFYKRDMLLLKIQNHNELSIWLKQLDAGNEIIITPRKLGEGAYTDNLLESRITLTPKGWESVFQKRQSLKSKKVFIAMQFDWGKELMPLKHQYVVSVKEACLECGYEADIVSEHHTEPILDKIIAGIKESHFVIADFTFNNRGAYFEAGYARALGIPVIHTVMEGHVDDNNDPAKKLHFDIQQINYIRWNKPEELKKKMVERIKAAIK